MTEKLQTRIYDRWAQLRFSIIGHLLADPPARGALQSAIDELARREWRHPVTFEPVKFGASTIQRWYYRALRERQDPVAVLRRKPRQDAGRQTSVSAPLRQALHAQYAAHRTGAPSCTGTIWPPWRRTSPALRPMPCYSTIRRYLEAQGLEKRRRPTSRRTAGALAAEAELAEREVRSYEAEHVRSLVHWDCHVGSRKVLTARGEWRAPVLFGVLDDRFGWPAICNGIYPRTRRTSPTDCRSFR